MVYQCEKQITELGDKAPKDLKNSIEGILADSKKVLEKADASLSELKDTKDSLQKTFEQLGQEAMKHAGNAGPSASDDSQPENPTPSDEGNSKSKDEDIVDADFEVVDESEKKE
jgi:molecular chaperone DnaK